MKNFRFGWTGLLVGLWLGWGQGDALAQKVYWTDVLNHKIQRANLECLLGPNPGSCIETVLDTLTIVPPNGTHPGAKSPNSVHVDVTNGWIYWSEFWTGVHRTRLDGQTTETIVPTPPMPIHSSWNPPVFLPGLNRESSELLRADIQGIALDRVNQQLYFGPDHPFENPLGSKYLYPNTDPPFAGARIKRSNLDGSSAVELVANAVNGFPGALGLDLTRKKMYWGNPTSDGYPVPNRLMRANSDGTGMETFLLLDGSSGPWLDPRDIAVDEAAGQVYFTTAYVGSIYRVNVDGTGLTQVVCCLDTPENLVLDVAGGKMYFAEVYRRDGSGGAVSRANLDGSGYEHLVTASSFPAGTFTDFPFAPNGVDMVNQPPIANAGASPTSGTAPLPVNFSSAGSSDPDGSIATYSWNFGDGGSSTSPNPSHTFDSPGAYTSVLTVTDNRGDQGTSSVNIIVQQDPNAKPDQVISSVTTSASSVAWGGSVTVTDTTQNQGTAQAAASTTFIYFSLDATLDVLDSKIGSRPVGVLNAGSSSSGSTPVTIPTTALPGTTCYLIVVADGANTVVESNETNNTRATPISIAVPVLIGPAPLGTFK